MLHRKASCTHQTVASPSSALRRHAAALALLTPTAKALYTSTQTSATSRLVLWTTAKATCVRTLALVH